MAQPKKPASKRAKKEYKGKVGVLGAGVAGLQVARSLKARGIDCVVFDKAPDVGGLWRDNYLDSGIQVPKLLYEFPDFPAPHGDFAKTPDVQKYIKSFVDKFELAPLLRLNTKVEEVSGGAGSAWTVKVTGPKGAETHSFDYFVVCQGMYNTTPNMPKLPANASEFKGKVIHSSAYTDLAAVKGKKVVVVGSGKSAVDIALHASKNAADSTLLFRQAHWGTPYYIAGLIPFKFVFTGRLGQALVSWYKGAWPTQQGSVQVAHWLLWPVIAAAFRLVELIFAVQFGHFGAWRPEMDFVKDFYGYAQIHSSEYGKAVSAGKLKRVKGEIASFRAGGVTTAGGVDIDADVVVCATGFGKSYPFFTPALQKQLEIDDDGMYLYRHMLAPKVEGLAFIGSESASLSNICTYGIQAEWLARLLTQRIEKASEGEMNKEIDMFKKWKRSWMPKTASRAGLILAHWIHYQDCLLRDMGEPHRRFGFNWLAEIFHPYDARAYKGLIGSN